MEAWGDPKAEPERCAACAVRVRPGVHRSVHREPSPASILPMDWLARRPALVLASCPFDDVPREVDQWQGSVAIARDPEVSNTRRRHECPSRQDQGVVSVTGRDSCVPFALVRDKLLEGLRNLASVCIFLDRISSTPREQDTTVEAPSGSDNVGVFERDENNSRVPSIDVLVDEGKVGLRDPALAVVAGRNEPDPVTRDRSPSLNVTADSLVKCDRHAKEL